MFFLFQHHFVQKHQSVYLIVFKDDEESVTSMFLYAQIFRQLNKHSDVFGQNDAGKERTFTFGIKVQFFNSLQEPVEEYILKDNCDRIKHNLTRVTICVSSVLCSKPIKRNIRSGDRLHLSTQNVCYILRDTVKSNIEIIKTFPICIKSKKWF